MSAQSDLQSAAAELLGLCIAAGYSADLGQPILRDTLALLRDGQPTEALARAEALPFGGRGSFNDVWLDPDLRQPFNIACTRFLRARSALIAQRSEVKA
jgi:hypothetical protein